MNFDLLSAPEPDQSRHGIWSRTALREASGVVSVGGVPVTTLAEEFGTPAYILDLVDMRARAFTWKDAMDGAFADLAGAQVYYAGKAFMSKAVVKEMVALGLHIDCASEGELLTALAAGAPGHLLGLHGNNKSARELSLAIDHQIAHVVVDSLTEIDALEELAAAKDARVRVYIRVTTGVHAGGHEFIATSHEDQKFGLSIHSGAAREAILRAHEAPHLDLIGLHSHIGSQIFALEGFRNAVERVLDLRASVWSEDLQLPEVDLGGGYAIRYTANDDIPPTPYQVAAELADAVSVHSDRTGLPAPVISIEPGRSIIGPAMLTLYRVGVVKTVRTEDGERRYVSVDGGMSDNIRPALYGANYTALLACRASAAQGSRARVVGKHCESGDIVVHSCQLPDDVVPNDILAVPATGAYGHVMASNYNMIPRPPVVAVEDGEAHLIVRGETVEDLLARDLG